MPFENKEELRAYQRAWYQGMTGEKRAYRLQQMKRNNSSRRKPLYAYAKEVKSEGCTDCGNKDMRVLEFDHLPGTLKKHSIARMCKDSMSLIEVQQEIDKCEVVCSNCHRIRTYNRRV